MKLPIIPKPEHSPATTPRYSPRSPRSPRRPSPPGLALPRAECTRFGVLWGVNLAQFDFEKYLLYVVLSASAAGCGFLDTYAAWALAGTFVAFASETLTGMLMDLISSARQRVLLISLSVGELACLAGMLVGLRISSETSLRWAQRLFVARQVFMMQGMSAVWKLLKIRVCCARHEEQAKRTPQNPPMQQDSDGENMVSSLVGTTGDLTSEIFELAVLGTVALLSARSVSLDTIVNVVSYSSVALGLANLILSLSTPNCTGCPLTEEIVPSPKPSRTISPSDNMPDAGVTRRRTTVIEEEAETDSVFESDQEEVDEEKDETDDAEEKTLVYRLREARMYFRSRVYYIMETPTVKHSLIQALLNFLLYGALAYPVTLLVTQEGAAADEDPTTIEAEATPGNLCNGLTVDLLHQGALLNLGFLVGTVFYVKTLMHIPPAQYYRRVLPILCAVAGLCVIVLSAFQLPKPLRMVVLSISQVLPYYLNSYDYYVLCTAIWEEYYGFVMCAYGLLSHLAGIAFTSLLSADVSLGVLLTCCIAMLVLSAWHGLIMQKYYVSPDWATASQKVTIYRSRSFVSLEDLDS